MPQPWLSWSCALLALLLLAGPPGARAEPLPRAAAEAAFQQAARDAKAARDAVQALREAGAKAEDPMVEAASRQSREAEAFLAETRAALGETLATEYRQRDLRLSTRPGERWAAGDPALCLDLANTGPLAVRAIGLALRLRGAPLMGDGAAELFRAEDRMADILLLTGPKEDGLPPWRSWRQPEASCAKLDPAPAGAAGRLLRRLGGFSRDARDWQFVLTEVSLARPAALRAGADPAAADAPHHEVFAEEIARLEQQALGARPAAPRPAAAVVPGDPALARVQEALGARGYRVGAPDGLPGPRTVAAVQSFQESRGEAATGVLTEAQLAALLGGAR